MPDLEATLRRALADRYDLEREIGEGASAVVFVARDRKHERRVAIKVLKPAFAEAISSERFRREIEAVAGLAHPHIVPLHDSGEADGRLWYVMPYLAGETLRDRMDREGALPVAEAVRIARTLSDALAHAHARGVVHRDVKPGNVMLSDGHALLMDFGIARLGEKAARTLTEAGVSVGTPYYMSPEQIAGDAPVDTRSDLYALGCVLFEMVTGAPPFRSASVQAVLTQHLVDDPPDLRSRRPEAPESLDAVVRTALAKAPTERFASARAMSDALAAVEEGRGRAARRRAPPAFRRVRWGRAAAVAGIVALLLGVPALVYDFVRSDPAAFAVADPRGSYVTVAFERTGESPEEQALALAAVDELSMLLDGWERVDAVLEHELGGAREQLGLTDPVLTSLDDALALARTVRKGTLVGIRVRLRGDSAAAYTRLYDVASGEPLGPSIVTRAMRRDVSGLVEPVAAEILGVRGEDPEARRRESSVAAAWQEIDAARRALYDWKLEEAERRFRAAIDLDPEFARPYHYLAVTLFWRTARFEERELDLGPEIDRLSATAYRLADSLEVNPRLFGHVVGFRRFWEGDHAAARARFGALIARDSTDSEAWLFAGAVDWKDDAWRTDDATGDRVPRGSVNLARSAFRRAVRLWPEFQVSRGLAFEIDRVLASQIRAGSCSVFFPPDGTLVPPWREREAIDDYHILCPVLRDTVRWLPLPESRAVPPEDRAGMSMRLHESLLASLADWAEFAPEQPRPHEEWVKQLLWWRGLFDCAAEPAEIDGVTGAIVEHAERALALRADTVAEDLLRLAAYRSAAGTLPPEEAAAAAEAAIASLGATGDSTARTAAEVSADLFLAAGRPARAIEVMEPFWTERDRSWKRDDADSSLVYPFGPVFDELGSLAALGASGARGAPLLGPLEEIEEVWRDAAYTERARAVLHQSATTSIRPALAADPEVRRRWFEGWGELREGIPAVWRGLLAADVGAPELERWLSLALADLDDGVARGRSRAVDHYATGRLAAAAGDHEEAVARFARLDACPVSLTEFDPAWALRRLVRLDRARSLGALGRTTEARRELEALLVEWEGADSVVQPAVDEARAELARIGSGR